MMKNIKQLFHSFSTPTVSDALDSLGIPGQCLGIKPLHPDFRVCGPCFTLDYEPVSGASDKTTVGDFIDDVEPGEVVLIANFGRTNCSVWGDILTLAASKLHIEGTVIDGVCRDSKASLVYNYPVFAIDHIMRTGKGRVALKDTQKPIKFCGITVSPGDIIFGDADGIVVVPASHVKKVIEISLRIEKTEEKIRDAFLQGNTLKDAREKFGYYSIEAKGEKK